MGDTTISIKLGEKVLATGTMPELDPDNPVRSMIPQEVGEARLIDSTSQVVTVEEVWNETSVRERAELKFIVTRDDGERYEKPVSVIRAGWNRSLAAWEAFQKGSPHTVTITLPSKKEIQKVTGADKKSAPKHPAHPLIGVAGQKITLQINVPPGQNFHDLSDNIAGLTWEALSSLGVLDAKVVKALKEFARVEGIGGKAKVKFGFVETTLQGVAGQADAAKIATKADPSTIPPTSPYLGGANLQTLTESAHGAKAALRKIGNKILDLIELLLKLLGGGNPDALAMLQDCEAAYQKLMASEAGVVSSEKKAKIRALLDEKHKEFLEEQELAAQAYADKDGVASAEHTKLSEEAKYAFEGIKALLPLFDQFTTLYTDMSAESSEVARRYRQSRDAAKRSTMFG